MKLSAAKVVNWLESRAGAGTPAERWVLAISLGALGFLLNGLPIAISQGVDIVLGGAFVFAAYRLVSRAQFAAAFSLSALRTIFLWNHPWAWLTWTLEGCFLAMRRGRTSPVLLDVWFWVFGGSVLLWVTYGLIIAMDPLSWQLVILKQSINAILNVTLGEILYIVLSLVLRPRLVHWSPRVSIGSIILPSLMALTILPSVMMMWIEAPSWKGVLRASADVRLQDNLDENRRRVANFYNQSVAVLQGMAGARQAEESTPLSESHPAADLFAEFLFLSNKDAGGLAGGGANPSSFLKAVSEARDDPQFADLVLAWPAQGGGWIMARPNPATLKSLVLPATINVADSLVMLVDPKHRIAAASGSALPERSMLKSILEQPAGGLAEVWPMKRFGTPLMNRTKEAVFVRSSPVAQFPGWRLVTVSSMRAEILEQRRAEARVLGALAAAIIILAILANFVAAAFVRRLRATANQLSQLATSGADPAILRSVMVSELAEIMTSVAITGERLSHEREFLQTNRRRFESIAKYAPMVIFSYERTGNHESPLTYISPNAMRVLGYSLNDMAKPGWWFSILHPDDRDAGSDKLRLNGATTREYRLRHAKGHYIWVYECVAVSEGNSKEVVGVLIDISARKKIGEQLGFATKMESLGRIASGIAHELNQPLQIIRLAAQNLELRLQKAPDSIPGAAMKLEIIKGQIDRAARIVRQVNAFGKPQESSIRPIGLAEILEGTCNLLRMQISEDEAAIVYEPISPSLIALADPMKLEQVLINLVQNARQSIAKSGRRRATGRVVVHAARADGGIVIAVEDNGTGIDPADLPFLFEPFFTTKSAEGGTGLGLSVSYGIINDMGGRIWAENVGKGARFSVWLRQAEGRLEAGDRPVLNA
jgi:PAS domain S-box-containing protein